jgi:multiple sugar transport system substrate-binding protein
MTRMGRKARGTLIGAAVMGLLLTACGGGSSGGGGGGSIDTSKASGTVSYWLWDNNQQPAYQACADAFHTANPNITVKISQYGWDDYWGKVTNGFVAGTAPDVFTDHLSKYPEFVTQGQLVALDDVLSKDGVKTDGYEAGLADLWVGQDGKRYGLPKDWDTISIFYNKDMTKNAGLTDEQMNSLTWNPADGGTYEKAIAHLSIDKNGKRGDEAGFDKGNVKVYGLGLDGGSGGGNGQTQWSMYTGTTGWQYTDKNPWGTKYNYNDPKFQSTIAWFHSLQDKGYMPTLGAVTGQSSSEIFAAKKYAMITNGSWMINTFYGFKGIKVGTALTPVGPGGKRASMFNGLADSIWVGSKNQAAAAKWVEFLGSAACQDVVGQKGVVFPAIPSGVEKAEAAFKSRGIDVTSFTQQVKDKTTFLFPITDNASQVDGFMTPAMDAVMSGKAPASSLTKANDEVNALFG